MQGIRLASGVNRLKLCLGILVGLSTYGLGVSPATSTTHEWLNFELSHGSEPEKPFLSGDDQSSDDAQDSGDITSGDRHSTDRSVEVSFELPAMEPPNRVAQPITTATDNSSAIASSFAQAEQPQIAPLTSTSLDSTLEQESSGLFEGGSNSLVAKAVGSAEGTRTPDGGKTQAYYGHVDPGNGAWNLGSFSYQHGATTPEEADEKQLRRLQRQAQELQQQATANRITLTLEEKLNGIDLANQSPAAALDRGYIVWLTAARNMGLSGSEAVLWARTRSYLDPDSGRWNAPGLGNTIHSISHDQERRMNAVNRAIAIHQQAQLSGAIANRPIPTSPSTPVDRVEQIIFQDLLKP